ncbi:MAG: serine--tRNA ligase, partial [Pelagibacteraceae bacterium]
MHNIKDIRKNLDFFKKKLSERNVNIDFDDLIDLDKQNRELIQSKEKKEQEKKILSKSKEEKNFELSKKLSLEINDLESKQAEIQKKVHDIVSGLPNIAHDD